jgi:coenzyme F420-reducing hydrogenase beta subunit
MNPPTRTQSINQSIREEAARILNEGVVDVVIGFGAGTLALRTQPTFITTPQEADRLIHNGFGQNNLASYLTRRPREERIGIVCRGCESRAVRVLVSEYQKDRETLHVIGVPCAGVVDLRKIQGRAGLKPEQFADVSQVVEQEDEVIITLDDQEYRFQRADVIHDSCKRCPDPNPVGADVVLGESLPGVSSQETWNSVQEFEDLASGERYAYFVQESERCIRCYACREACPMCYCTECFVDHNFPRWLESMITPAGTQAWHIVRAFHQTGRCASCGACERACPMDIKMTYLTDKLNYDMLRQYEFEVGASDDAQPPFATFTLDDEKRFVR